MPSPASRRASVRSPIPSASATMASVGVPLGRLSITTRSTRARRSPCRAAPTLASAASACRVTSASRCGSAPRTGSSSCSGLRTISVTSAPKRTGQLNRRSMPRRDAARGCAKRISTGRKPAPTQRWQAASTSAALNSVACRLARMWALRLSIRNRAVPSAASSA